jgi:predicted O-methyltransferase YrrM
MSLFDQIGLKYEKLPYMNHRQARTLRQLIRDESAEDILEIGFFHGKSSLYIAAVLEDQGKGHLTTLDLRAAERRQPNIHQVLEATGLSHRVTPVFCHRSYTWELQRMITSDPVPQFDLCYFDGGHTWDNTGFGVLLVDMLLRPGGLILLDDMDWSLSSSQWASANPNALAQYSEDERAARTVRLVWDTILPHLGYDRLREIPEHKWGLARKPSKAPPRKKRSVFGVFGSVGG